MADVSNEGQWVNRQVRLLKEVERGYTPFQENDVLFAKITPCTENGKGAHATGLANGIGFGSTEFYVLRPKLPGSGRFLFHWSQSEHLRRKASSVMIGSAGQQRVPNWFFGEFEVPLFPLPEQRRIAEILDTADEAIRQTERVIAKLKAVKAGLLHDLLTRGLDEHGRLRDPAVHPEQFKDSPLGRIPREWEVQQLKDLAHNLGDYGSGAAALERNPSLPRYVRITDITDDGRLDRGTLASISRSDAEGYYLQTGDLVFARSGATVGKTYLYDESDGECAHAGYVIKFALNSDLCEPRFVFYWTQSGIYWSWVKRTLRQGAQPNINAQEYSRLQLATPPLEEQRQITATLCAHEARTRAEETALAKLRQVKRGLMDDLLSGRVRVQT